jgi:hypothetical protein
VRIASQPVASVSVAAKLTITTVFCGSDTGN